MFRFLLILFISLGYTLSLAGQSEVEWLTWEQALERMKVEKRKIIVDVQTTWCSWCKKMDARTYKKESIATKINEEFYAIRFDGEHKEDIIFNNKIYSYVSGFGKKGYHELAKEIMNGRMSYPTTVFMDENLKVIQPIPGFQGETTFRMIMDYFSGNFYTHTPWHKFERNYSRLGQPTTPANIQPQVQPVRNH